LQQLQATQTELAAVSASKASLDADYSASQQQLEAKAAELEGLQEEAARHQQQLQATQAELAAVSASKASLDADYSASQQQLEAKAAELEGLQEEAARHQQQLQATQAELAAVSASKASLDADYSASQQQLEAKAAELETSKRRLILHCSNCKPPSCRECQQSQPGCGLQRQPAATGGRDYRRKPPAISSNCKPPRQN
jgi:chromosome segregation ATPase